MGNKIEFETTRFDTVEVDEEEVYRFDDGILGFPNVHEYVVLNNPTGGPFKWLQSVKKGELAFAIVDPLMFRPDYVVDIPADEAANIDISDPEDAFVRVIVTVTSDPEKMTGNLKGPLIFNPDARKATQVVLLGDTYGTRHWIFPGPDHEPGDPAPSRTKRE